MLLAVAETQQLACAEAACKPAKRFFAYERRTLLCQLAFGNIRERFAQVFRRDKPQNRIAEEFQSLIALVAAAALVCVGGVRQRCDEQVAVLKFISDLFFKFIQ